MADRTEMITAEMKDAYIAYREQVFEQLRRNRRRARRRVHGANKSSAKKSEIKVVWIEEHDSTTDDLTQALHEAERESKGGCNEP